MRSTIPTPPRLVKRIVALLSPLLLWTSVSAQSVGYVTRQENDDVAIVDLNNGSVLGTIQTSDSPIEIARSPDGKTIYVAGSQSSVVDFIDAPAASKVGTTAVQSNPVEITVIPDGSKIYVANFLGGSVSVIDAATRQKITDIPTNFLCYDVASSPDGSRVYATSIFSTDIFVIDTATDSIVERIPMGRTFMGHIAISPDGRKAYVSEFRNRVNVLDLASRTVVKTIPINTSNSSANNLLLDVEIDPQGRFVYALGTDNFNVIDLATDTLLHTINVGVQLSDVASDPAGQFVYVTTFRQELATVHLNEVIKIETAGFTIQNRFVIGGLLGGIVLGGDTEAPVLTLPDDITAEAGSAVGAVVSYAASADDDVGVDSFGCSPGSGSVFPLGPTTVTCSAKDAASNESVGTFTVTVVDTTPPAFSNIPTDVSADAATATGAAVSYANPSAVDAVDGVVTVSCAPVSGSVFPIGVTAVTCNAADSHNNTASASFTVTVLTADLAVTQVVTPNPPTTRSNLVYTIKVTNNGLGNAIGVVISGAIPAGTNFVSASTSSDTTCAPDASGRLTCGIGNLVSGASATLMLTVYVTAPPNSSVSNTSAVGASTYDPDSTDNTATVSITVAGGSPTNPGPPPNPGPPGGGPPRGRP